ncbi:MAG: hypothetical protein V3V78_00535 [Candidatus Woesearchaeota archaeon]
MDICFPDKNEEEFIAIAKKLSIKELYFIYPFSKNPKQQKSKIEASQKQTKIKLNFGILAKQQEITKAKKLSKFVITGSSPKDQYVIEKLQPSLIFNFEKQERKDKFHYRTSGLNQVLCKLAKQNKVIIGFSFSEILNSKKRKILLGRIAQNLKFCKQYSTHFLFASFASSPFELRPKKHLKSVEKVLQKQI